MNQLKNVVATLKQELVEADERIEHLRKIVNDLVLIVRMYHNEYPFDEDHITKQKDVISTACCVAELPETIEDVAKCLDENCPGWR